MSHFQIDFKDIERLDPMQLTELLRILLFHTTKKHGLDQASTHVPLKISVPDGGEDGRVEWFFGPESVKWLPQRLNMFQCKAEEKMTPRDFANASLSKSLPAKPKAAKSSRGEQSKKVSSPDAPNDEFVAELKPQVEEVLDAGGAYIFFYSKQQTQAGISNALKEIRQTLRLANRNDAPSAKIEIYDANKIADWTNEHFAAVAQVCKWNHRDIPFSVQSWRSWSSYELHTVFSFVEDEGIGEDVQSLRQHLSRPRSVARILGNPGLGKSRLALQALSEPEHLNRSVVYIDAAIRPLDLVNIVRQFRERQDVATVVVDNCDLQLHQMLRQEVTHSESRLSLLTIDFDPGEQTGTSGSDVLIFLKPMKNDLIRQMLELVFGKTLPETELERIVGFSEGYPLMAALIARDRIEGKADAGTLNDDQLLERLLWGRNSKTDEAYAAIAGCALFSHVGFDAEYAEERIFVAEHCSRIDKEKFYEHIQDFLSRRIVQKRGDFVLVAPAPLAARLAADWWKKCSPDKGATFIESKFPGGLGEALCNQVKSLHYLPKVIEITKTLCGEQAPFGRPEVLINETGSLFFRAFVEVSPKDCVRAMERAFQGWDREQLLAVGSGRRNLVWALERMCFWPDIFPGAARLLYRFASAENETWSNNATGQFVQLYQLYLAGTQAPLATRADILEEKSTDLDGRKVVIKAAERAFHLDHFTRMGGVERQGSRPIEKDYEPRTGTEIMSYWTRCLNVLVSIAIAETPLDASAVESIENIIYPCIKKRFLSPLLTAMKQITDISPSYWYEARQKLDFAMQQQGDGLNQDEQLIVDELYDLLKPKSIRDRLLLWVIDASDYMMRQDESGEIVDDNVPKINQLAADCIEQLDELKESFPILLRGVQRNSFFLGKEMAKLMSNSSALISECERFLESETTGTENISFLAGLISIEAHRDRERIEGVLDRFAKSPALRKHVITLTTALIPDAKDIQRCLGLLSDPTVDVQEFVVLSYGNTLAELSPDFVLTFVEAVGEHSAAGIWAALSILNRYCYRSEERWKICKKSFSELIVRIKLVQMPKSTDSVIAGHNWSDICQKLLTEENVPRIAMHVAEQIVEVCKSENDRMYYRYDQIFQKLLPTILTKSYLDVVWTKLSESLLSDDWRLKLHMQWIFGHNIKQDDTPPGPLFSLPDDFLLAWSKTSIEAAKIIARSAPVFKEKMADSGAVLIEIEPLILQMISAHGGNHSFLSELTANISSFGGWGSNTPRYKARVRLFEQLSTHSLPAVREWANKELEYAESLLERAKKVDEEHDAGIWERF